MAESTDQPTPDESPGEGSSETNPYKAPQDTEPPRASASPGVLHRMRGRQAGIVFILITLFIDILGIGIVIPVLPKLVQELGHTDESGAAWYYGIIAASYAMMQFIFSPILGALSDRFGRRPILLGSLFGLGIDFVIQGFANSLVWLFVARIVSGVLGASFTTGNAYIADVSTDETRARNFGFVGVAFGLGFIVGPALGGVLGDVSTRLPFFVAAGLSLVNWLYGFFVLPESLPPEKRGTLTFENANPFASIRNLRRYPLVFGLSIVFTIKALAQRGLENVWVLFGSAKFQWSLTTIGLTLLWVGITTVIVQGALVRPIVKRFGERRVLLAATLISSLAFLGYSLASEGWVVFAVISFGALGGLAGPAVQSIVTHAVDETEQGQIQGALTQLQSVASIASPIIFTSGLFKFFTSDAAPFQFPGAPFLLGSILIFASYFVALAVFRRHPEPESSESESSESESQLSPTSQSPTSQSPTSQSPANLSPANLSPTNLSPTNLSPTNLSPTNLSPTNLSPTESNESLRVQRSPTSLSPTSLSPTSLSPTSLSPTSQSPTSQSPTSQSPTSQNAARSSRSPAVESHSARGSP